MDSLIYFLGMTGRGSNPVDRQTPMDGLYIYRYLPTDDLLFVAVFCLRVGGVFFSGRLAVISKFRDNFQSENINIL